LRFLGQQPPHEIARADVAALWNWAIPNWRRERVPRTRTARAPEALSK
jgi:hypothetical protein